MPGYFYTPKNVKLPAPALVVMHEWGGPMLFGSERVCGETKIPVLVEHRATYTSGRALADFYASNGYCVVVIDAFHFGRRAPRGIGGLPAEFDPFTLDKAMLASYETKVRDQLYLGVRQLNWAGTTWCGVNFGDDSRCVDYLLSRKEVDKDRIGVTGLSGGGWRTNILAALDDRIQAAVPVGWMTTGDHQQPYNVAGAIGTFCLLPGVWDRIDIPDLMAMAAPKACMVVSGKQDILFPPAGQREAARQITAAYEWAGRPRNFRDYAPDKPHCYDREIQEQALAWFTKAVEVNPNHLRAVHNQGRAAHRLKRYDQAAASYSRSIAMDPAYAEAHANLGRVLVEAGRRMEGLRELQVAVSLDPSLEQEQRYLNAQFGRDARQGPTPYSTR